MIWCINCKQRLPEDSFTFADLCTRERNPRCRQCDKSYKAAWYQATKPVRNEKRREYKAKKRMKQA